MSREYAIVDREFDRKYYLENNLDVNAARVDPCLHFVRIGWKENRNPAPWFDTAEYLRQYIDVRESGLNPFYHFLKFGRAENRSVLSPSRLHSGGPSGSPSDLEGMATAAQFNLASYSEHTGRGPYTALSEAIADTLKDGFVPLEALGNDANASAAFFLELGNACRAQKLHRQAQSFYLMTLEQNPNHFLALQQLGDLFLADKRFLAACHFYKSALTNNDRYFWTHANLAKALFELTRYQEAIHHAGIARELDPGSIFAEELMRSVCHNWGQRLIGSGFAAARNGDFARCRQLMNEAAVKGPARPRRSGLPTSTFRDASRPLHVVMLVDDALPQCLLYRVLNKAYQLGTQQASVQWFPRAQVKQFEAAVVYSDAVVIYRLPATPPIVNAIRYARSLGKPTFYDIDDLIFSNEHYPESFESYAGLISWEVYGGLVAGTELFRLAMRECDFGIASTAPLAEFMKKEVLTGEVIVVPNSLGPDHALPQPKRPRKDIVEIFYGSGTLAHKRDFEIFASDVLAPLLDKHSHVRIKLIGKFPDLAALKRFGSRVKSQPPNWNFKQYLRQLGEADINIAVLSPSIFNDCKSEIKWLEAGLLGVPSVVSNTETHRLAIENGKTGFLCEGNDEWLAALDRLVADADLRHSIGRAAQEVVTTAYHAEAVGARLHQELSARAVHAPSRRKIRIVVVNVFYPPQAIGGATRVVQENVDSLQTRYGTDIEVQVFTTTLHGEQPGEIRQYIHNNVRVTAITIDADPSADWRPKDEAVHRAFSHYLQFTKPDIVHFHCIQRLSGSVVEAAREAGIPYVVTVHDGWWLSDYQFLIDGDGCLQTGQALSIEGMKLTKTPRQSIDRTTHLRGLLAGAEAVLSVSRPFAEIYRSAGVTNVRTVENGTIRLPRIERDENAGEKIRVGFIGGLAVHKGYGLLRDVFKANTFKNLELVLVDHSQPEMKVQKTVWNGNPVTTIGRVRQNHIHELYASLDVVLAISLWPESFGLVTREAAQAGLWIVASDRGAIGDIVEKGLNGFRIDVSDASELERVLLTIDSAPEIYKKRTDYPLPQLRTFDEQVDELVAIYRDISQCGQGGQRPACAEPAAS